jgi:hypothetical protein
MTNTVLGAGKHAFKAPYAKQGFEPGPLLVQKSRAVRQLNEPNSVFMASLAGLALSADNFLTAMSFGWLDACERTCVL